MAGSGHAATGRVFISYRRDDTANQAAWLYDQLTEHFGARRVFKDVETIRPGDDFVEAIKAELRSCGTLLALIGNNWQPRRTRDRHDFVRLEIEAAFAGNVRVIPILVNGATMPKARDLPRSLARLARCQALEFTEKSRWAHLSELLSVLTDTLPAAEAPQLVRTAVCPIPGGASCVAFSHDGGLLAFGTGTGTVGLINLAAQSRSEVSETLGTKSGEVFGVAFSPRKWLLASADMDGAVRLWNLHTRQELPPLTGHRNAVAALAFSPDGQLLASGSLDHTVTLWEPEAGLRRRQRLTLRDQASVWAVAYSPDGRLLATSGGTDLKVRLWNPANGAHLRTLSGNHHAGKAAFSPIGWRAGGPTGWLLASASQNVAQLWYLAPPNA